MSVATRMRRLVQGLLRRAGHVSLGQRRGRWCLLATHQESHGHDARHESRRTLSCCESRVCGCSFFSGSTCCSPTPLPFTCERSITTLRHTNQTEHAKKRHGRQQNTRFVASSHGRICSCSSTHSMPLLQMCSPSPLLFSCEQKKRYMSGNNHSLSHAYAHAILRAVPFAAPYFCTQASRDEIPVNGICCTACSEFYQKPSSRYIPDTAGTRLPVVMVCAAEKDW